MRQLELNLGCTEDIKGPSEPWKFRFTRLSLVEEIGNTRYVYGLWSQFFGFWKIDLANNVSKEFIPTWRLFDDKGIWLSQAETRKVSNICSGNGLASKWLYEADAAFAGLFSDIPRQIRSVVTPMGRHQGLALDLIWHEPELAPFIDEEYFNGTEQYVFACLALSSTADLNRSDRKDLARQILRSKRSELISRLAGQPCDQSAINVLYKFKGDLERPAVYKALLDLMGNPETAKILRHATKVTPQLVKILLEMPSSLQHSILGPFILRALVKDIDELGIFESWLSNNGNNRLCIIIGILEVSSETFLSQVLNSLGEIRSLDDVIWWTKRWFIRLMSRYKFPSPPFPQSENLVPITSAEDIVEEARAMNNCLDTLIGDVLAGHTFFYRWNGAERATVMLNSVPDFGWMPTEALGLSNRPVASSTELEIRKVVARQLKLMSQKNR